MIADHVFGGVSTDLKLSVVERYLKAYTIALRGKFTELCFIDAFAGTRERTVRFAAQDANLFDPATPERIERFRGSARIAIDTDPPFNRLIFIEQKRKHCEALRAPQGAHPDRDIQVLKGEANEEILRFVSRQDWQKSRAVMFLDPYGMSVAWETLEAISQTAAIDVWYLASLSGLFRQATMTSDAIDPSKRAALNRMLGTADWEQVWYGQPSDDLFGRLDGPSQRTASVDEMENFVKQRLQSVFPKVCKPLRLRNDGNVPTFALFFAISNPEPRAIGLASRIADHILASGKPSQTRSL